MNLFGKKKTKDFEDWYNGSINGNPDIKMVKKALEERPYLLKLQQLILAGHKLTRKDVEEFWELFHESQRDAFNAGSK